MELGEIRSHFESTIRTRSGERRDISWNSTLQRDASGVVAGIATIGQDVTERRRADSLLRSREELFRSLIENASDVITIVAADGTSLYESPSVERLLGRKPEELVGMPSFALLHASDLELAERTFAAILAGEEPGAIEYRLRHSDGSWRTVEAIGRRRTQDGEWVVVVNYRDVTDQRQLREQLLHSQKLEAVGRLAGGIAHDFNNLLTAIGGYSQFLAAGFDDDDPRREDALEIVRASDRAAALTGQLLAFSRRQVLLAEVLDLGEVVAGLESMLSRLLGESVELATSVEPGCLVRADRGQLEQVITNLALNARDAMPSGGNVELAVRCLDGDVELTVSDTGVGMDPETIVHIFEPFFTTKDPGKGTGLGLATAYGIVTQSGGDISVDSRLGEGSTFRVVLPRSAELAAFPVEREERPEERTGTEGVLLAEDEETIRRLVGEVLARSGYTVFAASNGDEALQLLQEHPGEIDLLLTDVVMPGMSGPDLARAAARLAPSLRVLFTSGYTSEPDEAFDDPEVAFIGKPFSPQDLVAKVRDVLDAGLVVAGGAGGNVRERARQSLGSAACVGGAPDVEYVVERAEEEVEQLGVELRAALLLHHLPGFVGLERRAVDAVGDQRVEDVRDGADSALDRDLIAREAGGVARAVDPFVMRERHQRGEVEQVDIGAGEDVVTHLGVRLHHLALVVGEPAGLEHDSIGDPDLADVVHRARDPDVLGALGVEPGEAGEQGAVEAHADDVLARLLVAELGRPREAADRLFAEAPQLEVGGLELGDRVAERRRALEHGLLEPLAVAAVLDLQRAAPECVADVDDQLVRLEGLEDVAVGAEVDRDLREAAVVHAGDHDDGGFGVLREHLAREVDARLAGHVHVGEDERDRSFLERTPAGGRALGGDAVVSLRAEQAGEQGADLILVVDDQDPLAGGGVLISVLIGRTAG